MVTLCITHDRIGALRLGYKMARLLLNQVPNHTPYTNSCRPNATVANPISRRGISDASILLQDLFGQLTRPCHQERDGAFRNLVRLLVYPSIFDDGQQQLGVVCTYLPRIVRCVSCTACSIRPRRMLTQGTARLSRNKLPPN